jgi:CxxC motif-containing protein (DUF1111 family)
MSRILIILSAIWLVACTDNSDVAAPGRDGGGTSGASASPVELSFDAGVPDGAHTALSGGATTVFDASPDAFSLAAPNLSARSLERHETGDEGFEAVFVPGPAAVNGGLGPVFDNVACEACHEGDGRGRPPLKHEQIESLLFRASVSGSGPHGGPRPVPGFGGQLQLRAIAGFTPEVNAAISYVETKGAFTDGTRFQLRAPTYTITGLYSTLPAGTLISPRVAPAVFGLGLIEAVRDADLEALADPKDLDRNGISGQVNYVWDAVKGRTVVGRFGWKANAPNLVQQTAGAYNGDMGITSSIFPAESCEGQVPGCAPHAPEVNGQTVLDVAFYTQTLAVPARRNLEDPVASQGERLFHATGCGNCHLATLRTGALAGVPEVTGQIIHPYTDLLLHDMGPGLADDRPDFLASGREWRTPPLWGIGLVQTVNGHSNFLHDGRARSLLEAVLWHGGEAAAARDRVRAFSASERQALLAFLESL